MSPLPGPGRGMAAQDVESIVRLVIENRLGIRGVSEMGTLPTPVSGPVVPAWSHQLFSVLHAIRLQAVAGMTALSNLESSVNIVGIAEPVVTSSQ